MGYITVLFGFLLSIVSFAYCETPPLDMSTYIAGRKYKVVVEQIGNKEQLIYLDGNRRYTREELKAKYPWPRIDPDLKNMQFLRSSQQGVSVLFIFKHQPLSQIAEVEWNAFDKDLKTLRRAIRSKIIRSSRPLIESAEDEEEWIREYRKNSTRDSDLNRFILAHEGLANAVRKRIGQKVRSAVSAEQRRLATRIRNLGGEVHYQHAIVNSVSAHIPIQSLKRLASHPGLLTVQLVHTTSSQLNKAICSSGADVFRDKTGTSGKYLEVAVLDTGIDKKHPAFLGKSLQAKVFLESGSKDDEFFDNRGIVDDLHGHGTHVSGIVASHHSKFEGVAPKGSHIHAKAGFRTFTDGGMRSDDGMAAAEWAILDADDPAEVINLSFSGKKPSPEYEQFWDSVVHALRVPVTISVGNADGASSCPVRSPSVAHNVISVGNLNDRNTCNTRNDKMNSDSCRGPTEDGRSKPDIAAPGTSIRSANAHWEGLSSDFISLSGTSMAAPHVAGAMLLLMETGLTGLEGKALMLNTARSSFDSWDRYEGWGALDLDHAAYHLPDVKTHFLCESSSFLDCETRLVKGPAYSGDTATLVVNRRASWKSSSVPDVSTISMEVYKEESNGLTRYAATGLNNVAQVQLRGTFWPFPPKKVVLSIKGRGKLGGVGGTEVFALATEEGFEEGKLSLDVKSSVGIKTIPGTSFGTFYVTSEVKNNGNLIAHDVRLTVTIPHFVLGDITRSTIVGSLKPGESVRKSYPASLMPSGKKGKSTARTYSYGKEEIATDYFRSF